MTTLSKQYNTIILINEQYIFLCNLSFQMILIEIAQNFLNFIIDVIGTYNYYIAECSFSLIVVFDPASFYGHHEFELSIAGMFGGFNSTFYQAYHAIIPKAPGFEARHKLYQLYHCLNHWYVFITCI